MTIRSAIVVGAGIVGAACAERLARQGVAVTIVDRAHPGGGTTAEGMGHLVVMDDSPAQIALTLHSRQLWNTLSELMPKRVEHQPCGTLWVAANDLEMQDVHTKHHAYGELGVETRIIDRDELRRLEPNLARDLVGALEVPGDSVLYAPTAAQWLVEQAETLGAITRFGSGAASLTGHTVLLENGEQLEADAVINAAGIGAASLTPELVIRPRKGHLLITDRYPGFIQHQIVELGYLHNAHSSTEDSVAFNLQPRGTGQVLIGSSRQFDREDRGLDRALLERMIVRALRYAPALRKLMAIRAWVGFRPATPDNLPYVGPWPDEPGLWICAGHEGLGISTSLGSASLLVDQMLGRDPAIDPEPFLPQRVREAHHAE